MFKIEERNDRYYVLPTAEYVLEKFDRFSFPYDTNWEIYRLFKYPPEQFCQYLVSQYRALVTFKNEFPFIDFSFSTYSTAEEFKKELEERALLP